MFNDYRGKMDHDQIIREMEVYYTRKASLLDNKLEIVNYIESEGFREDLMNQLGLDHDLERSKIDLALGEGNEFKPSNGEHLKPLERKAPETIEEIIDLVYYFKYDEKGKTDWISMKHYVDEQSDPEWSNTMGYLLTGKGPGDYGDKLD